MSMVVGTKNAASNILFNSGYKLLHLFRKEFHGENGFIVQK